MRRITLVCYFALFFAASLALAQEAASHQSLTSTGQRRVTLTNMLVKYGRLFGLYFTIEEDAAYAQGSGAFVDSPDAPKSAEEFLDLLRKWRPDCTVTPDSLIPALVHIREKSLDKLGKLGLDEKTSLTFHGSLADLFAQIDKATKGSLQERRGGVASGVVHTYNRQLPAIVDAKNVTYRDILDLGIPYDDGRIVWTASTQDSITYFKPGFRGSQAVATQPASHSSTQPATMP